MIAEAASSSMTECVSHQRGGRGESVSSGQLRFRVNVLVTSISVDWSVSVHTLRKGESLHRPPNPLRMLPMTGKCLVMLLNNTGCA